MDGLLVVQIATRDKIYSDRTAVKKPFIQIKDVLVAIPFGIVNMRTINVDYRWIDIMDKCRDKIVKQNKEIEVLRWCCR